MTMNDTININGTEYRFERKGEQLPEFTIGKHSWAQYLQENGGGFFFTVGMIGHTGEKVHSIYTQFITVNGDKVILGFQAVCGSAKINSRTRRIITQPEVNCKCCAKRMAKNIQ